MSPLFRRSEEKLAQRAAADAEIARIRERNIDALAIELLPVMGPDGIGKGVTVRSQQLCEYLLRDYPAGKGMKALDLLSPVREALEELERSGLVEARHWQRTPVWRITRLGKQVLADGTLEERLNRRA